MSVELRWALSGAQSKTGCSGLSSAAKPTLAFSLERYKPTMAQSTVANLKWYLWQTALPFATAVCDDPTTTHSLSALTAPYRKDARAITALLQQIYKVRYCHILRTTMTNGYNWGYSVQHRLKCCKNVELSTVCLIHSISSSLWKKYYSGEIF